MEPKTLSCQALEGVACAALASRHEGRWRVLVVVKATLAMVHDAPMTLGPTPRIVDDRDFEPLRTSVAIRFPDDVGHGRFRVTFHRDMQPVAGDAVGHLRGNEWLEVVEELPGPLQGRGMHVRTALPRARGMAMMAFGPERAYQPIPLVADDVYVRPASGRVDISWRGHFDVVEEAELESLSIAGALAFGEVPVAWPVAGSAPAPRQRPARAPAPQARGTSTVTLTDADGRSMTLAPGSLTTGSEQKPSQTVTVGGEQSHGTLAPFEVARAGTSHPAHAPITAHPALPASFFARQRAAQPSPVPARTTESIPIANDTAFDVVCLPWQHQPPQDSMTVVVKGTFDMVVGGAALVREACSPVTGNVDEETGASLRYASDFALFKPAADVTLVGHAHAPESKGVTAMEVRFRFGHRDNEFDRRVAVLGARTWERSVIDLRPGEPAPFKKIALTWENAFGGVGHDDNPVGRGRGAAKGTALPHLENPRALIDRPRATPPPACMAPIHPAWKARHGRMGTYDDPWLRTRWPYFPADFDWSYFQSAPRAQRLDYLTGDEPFVIAGAHPNHPVIEGTLAGLRPRCFMVTKGSALGVPGAQHAFERVVLHLDTVAFDTDAMCVQVVWRGVVEVSDEHAPEIEWLYLAAENVGDDIDDAALYRRFITHVAPLVAVASPSPPANDVSTTSRLDAELDEVGRETAARVARLPAASPGGALLDPPPAAADLRRIDDDELAGAALKGADLRARDFSGKDLRGINLEGAVLVGSVFTAADLQDALLAGADLRDAVFDAANLVRADLSGANLEGASFVGALVEDMNASHARGDGSRFLLARGKRLRLSGGSWENARFEGADLERLDLSSARFGGARFDDAKLPWCRLFDGHGEATSFVGADISDALCDGVVLERGDLGRISGSGSCWEDAELEGCNFLDAELDDTNFVRARLAGADMSACSLRRARFKRAAAARVKLVKSDLAEAQLERGDFAGADLTGANLYGAELWHTNLDGAVLTGAHLAHTKREE